MKKFCVMFLFLLLVFLGCDKAAVSPVAPEILLKADVRIAILNVPFIESAFALGIYITEHNGVKVSITSIEVQLFYQGILVYVETGTTVRTLSANGHISVLFVVVLEDDDAIDKIRITVKGIDVNGHRISVSEDFS